MVVLRSFNPLDVAHVFNAPLLRDMYDVAMASYVQKEEGLMRVRCSAKDSASSGDVGLVRARVEDRGITAVCQ
jgi:hypothetical protein